MTSGPNLQYLVTFNENVSTGFFSEVKRRSENEAANTVGTW